MKISMPSPLRSRLSKVLPVLALTAVVAGCAHVPNPNPNDPWESYNRSMFAFNETVDKAFMKPIAQGYEAVMPQPARSCVSNIFNNFHDAWSSVNSFLQGRPFDGINSLGRVLMNTTMGIGGCIDVASMNGVPRIVNDFGVTLGVWGFEPGPYVVLPFLGASNVRDGTSTVAWFAYDYSPPYAPIFAIDNIPVRNSIIALAVIDMRASLLNADDMVDRIALDRYAFIRDAYIQRRAALVQGRSVDPDTTPAGLPKYEDNDTLPDYSDDEDMNGENGAANPASGSSQPAGQ
jgi:phospholipid-binding lipoprotein MlaA|tara:strand:+ start:281016 stop:281885 length:870 start_codon:yes stop_codon:yes gene_type:complete